MGCGSRGARPHRTALAWVFADGSEGARTDEGRQDTGKPHEGEAFMRSFRLVPAIMAAASLLAPTAAGARRTQAFEPQRTMQRRSQRRSPADHGRRLDRRVRATELLASRKCGRADGAVVRARSRHSGLYARAEHDYGRAWVLRDDPGRGAERRLVLRALTSRPERAATRASCRAGDIGGSTGRHAAADGPPEQGHVHGHSQSGRRGRKRDFAAPERGHRQRMATHRPWHGATERHVLDRAYVRRPGRCEPARDRAQQRRERPESVERADV